jgi:hypothetical protein
MESSGRVAEHRESDAGARDRNHEGEIGHGGEDGLSAHARGNPAAPLAVNGTGSRALRAIALRRSQQTYGNRAVQRMVAEGNRKCDCGGSCASCAPAGGHILPADTGDALEAGTRSFMEKRYQADFSDVRVHTSSAAAASATGLDANAYTAGRDIYFAAGQYAPATTEGRHLLAHELAHTVQQSGSSPPAAGVLPVVSPGDPQEVEAEHAADMVLRGDSGTGISHRPPAVARQVAPQFYDSSAQPNEAPFVGLTAENWFAIHAGELLGYLRDDLPDADVAIRTEWVAWKEEQARLQPPLFRMVRASRSGPRPDRYRVLRTSPRPSQVHSDRGRRAQQVRI